MFSDLHVGRNLSHDPTHSLDANLELKRQLAPLKVIRSRRKARLAAEQPPIAIKETVNEQFAALNRLLRRDPRAFVEKLVQAADSRPTLPDPAWTPIMRDGNTDYALMAHPLLYAIDWRKVRSNDDVRGQIWSMIPAYIQHLQSSKA